MHCVTECKYIVPADINADIWMFLDGLCTHSRSFCCNSSSISWRVELSFEILRNKQTTYDAFLRWLLLYSFTSSTVTSLNPASTLWPAVGITADGFNPFLLFSFLLEVTDVQLSVQLLFLQPSYGHTKAASLGGEMLLALFSLGWYHSDYRYFFFLFIRWFPFGFWPRDCAAKRGRTRHSCC